VFELESWMIGTKGCGNNGGGINELVGKFELEEHGKLTSTDIIMNGFDVKDETELIYML
jgi:hypothetical protein